MDNREKIAENKGHVNWSKCPNYANCKDKYKDIMTYCDTSCSSRSLSSGKPPELTDEQIAEHAVVCWEGLYDHEQESFRAVARAAEANRDTYWQAECAEKVKQTKAETAREIIPVLKELTQAMHDYEVEVDVDAPQKHKNMMKRVDEVLVHYADVGKE